MITPGKCDARSVTIQAKKSVTMPDNKQTELLQQYFDKKRAVLGGSWPEGLNWFYKKTAERVAMKIVMKNKTIKNTALKITALKQVKKSAKSTKSGKSTKAAASSVGVSESVFREHIDKAIAQSNGANIKKITDAISLSLVAANKKQQNDVKDQFQQFTKSHSKMETTMNTVLQKLGVNSLKGRDTLVGHVSALPIKIQTEIANAQSTITTTINNSTDVFKTYTSTAQNALTATINNTTDDMKTHTSEMKTFLMSHITTEMEHLTNNFGNIIANAVRDVQQSEKERHHRELEVETAYFKKQNELSWMQGYMTATGLTNVYDPNRSIGYGRTASQQTLQANLQTIPFTSLSSTSSSTSYLPTNSPASPSGQQNVVSSPLNSLTSYNPYTQPDNGLDTQNQKHDLSTLTVQHHSHTDKYLQ